MVIGGAANQPSGFWGEAQELRNFWPLQHPRWLKIELPSRTFKYWKGVKDTKGQNNLTESYFWGGAHMPPLPPRSDGPANGYNNDI